MKKMKLSHKTVLSLVLSAVLLCMPVAAFAMNEGNAISVQAEDLETLETEETTSEQDVQDTENATEENATEDVTEEATEDSTGETEEGGTVSGNDIAESVCICEDRCGLMIMTKIAKYVRKITRNVNIKLLMFVLPLTSHRADTTIVLP